VTSRRVDGTLPSVRSRPQDKESIARGEAKARGMFGILGSKKCSDSSSVSVSSVNFRVQLRKGRPLHVAAAGAEKAGGQWGGRAGYGVTGSRGSGGTLSRGNPGADQSPLCSPLLPQYFTPDPQLLVWKTARRFMPRPSGCPTSSAVCSHLLRPLGLGGLRLHIHPKVPPPAAPGSSPLASESPLPLPKTMPNVLRTVCGIRLDHDRAMRLNACGLKVLVK
jgi:hypothetical protein